MSAPTPTVTAYFNITGSSSFFILNDPVKGVLDNATYTLGGDVATDISRSVRVTSITRGRDRALGEISVGVAQLTANNRDRIFDPENAAGAYFGNIKPGKRVTVAAGGVTIFDGLIDDWNFAYQINTDSTAAFDVVDCLATLGSAEFDEWTTTAGQTTGARINSILDRPEVQFPATRNIDVGTSTLQADLVSWGSNVLNYAQLVAKCDVGQLFAARDGVLTFYGRNRSVTGVGALEFRDDGIGIPYVGINLDYGTELLFNRVSVDAIGFATQTVVNEASATEFGGGGQKKYYSLSLSSLPLETQQQALDLANYLLNLYSQPVTRISSVTVALHDERISSATAASILSLDIGSVIRVIYTPNDIGTAIDKYCMVEGVDHQLAPKYHAVTLKLSNLADGFSGQPFILDSAEYGKLGGPGVLAF